MIEQVLQDVKQTEEQAATIIAAGEQKAADIRLSCDEQVSRDWDTIKAQAKARRSERMEQAKCDADEKVDAIRRQTQQQCLALDSKTQGKIDGIVQQLMERISHGDC